MVEFAIFEPQVTQAQYKSFYEVICPSRSPIAGQMNRPNLITDYYRAFVTSASNFPGQIQSTIIDTSSKSVLTCLYNNEKILKII